MSDKQTTIHKWHELTTMIMALQANLTSFLEDNHTLHPAHARDLASFGIAMNSIYILVTELEPIEAVDNYDGYDPEIFMTRLQLRIKTLIEQAQKRLED